MGRPTRKSCDFSNWSKLRACCCIEETEYAADVSLKPHSVSGVVDQIAMVGLRGGRTRHPLPLLQHRARRSDCRQRRKMGESGTVRLNTIGDCANTGDRVRRPARGSGKQSEEHQERPEQLRQCDRARAATCQLVPGRKPRPGHEPGHSLPLGPLLFAALLLVVHGFIILPALPGPFPAERRRNHCTHFRAVGGRKGPLTPATEEFHGGTGSHLGHGHLGRDFLAQELPGVQRGVHAAGGQQSLVSAALDDAAVLHNQDLVGSAHR